MSLLDTTGGMLPRRAAPDDRRRRLGDLLADAGAITRAQLQQALEAQKAPGPRRRLGETLIALGFVDERDIAVTLAEQLGLDTLDLSTLSIDPAVVRRLPQQLSERSGTVVVQQLSDGRYIVAMSDPTNVLALDDVRLTLGAEVLPIIAIESQIRDQLRRVWGLSGGGERLTEMVSGIGEEVLEDIGNAGVDDAPTVQLVTKILAEAVQLGASDIHVETQRDSLRIRFRIDGILRDVMTAPRKAAGAVLSRIKIVSGLDIAERRVPQDGRTQIVVGGARVDTRVSTLPSLHGEKAVIRILTKGDDVPALDVLGFEPDQLEAFRRALHTPQGLVLITGPTGSGKTNTLYAGIAEILDPEKNIVTLEDPVEVQLPGITQVQVNNKAGMTFQAGLRSVLRQDPDIVLVGEVRDSETSELALKAALTGHLVLTTLHTNSAAAALTRLIDMGSDPFLVASSLTLAVAQRLVRRPCAQCAVAYVPADDLLALLGLRPDDLVGATPRKGFGCSECGHTGYKGRTAVYEVLTVDAEMRRILVRDPSEDAVVSQAKAAGMRSLRASALQKAMDGRTTFEEVVRVTTADSGGGSACPACDRPVERGMVACPYCAADLEAHRCRSCSKELEPAWALCPWCRTAVAESAPPTGAHDPAAHDTDTHDLAHGTGAHDLAGYGAEGWSTEGHPAAEAYPADGWPDGAYPPEDQPGDQVAAGWAGAEPGHGQA
ncbi:ATPase, T2SS/T4P/T4SS family [Aquipuribacter hungaricus]|uniref:ATPase, T2SS/T4P/T4SS family n=1 Tax=Aquipuribacter hungaricus TaxID=545624 RepID=A0ABV7WCG6_9MICO